MDYLTPRWESSALVVIDVQQDFIDGGAAPIPGTSEVLPGLGRLVEAFRASGRPIVHIVRLYVPGGSDVDPPRRAAVEAGLRLAAPDSHGSQLVPAVLGDRYADLDVERLLAGKAQSVGDSEIVLFKPRWGAFYRTDLEAILREWEVDTVVVAGCNLPNCPRATLFEASERDFRAVLVADSVSQVTPERTADLANIGVHLATTVKVITALAREVPSAGTLTTPASD